MSESSLPLSPILGLELWCRYIGTRLLSETSSSDGYGKWCGVICCRTFALNRRSTSLFVLAARRIRHRPANSRATSSPFERDSRHPRGEADRPCERSSCWWFAGTRLRSHLCCRARAAIFRVARPMPSKRWSDTVRCAEAGSRFAALFAAIRSVRAATTPFPSDSQSAVWINELCWRSP
jgi:hypothetical protein